MAIEYQQKCIQCKKNFVLVSSRTRGPRICFECQKSEMEGEITDPKLKKLLDIPDKYYKENSFLRSIKINCIKYGSLSEKQIEVFKEVVKKLETDKK